MRRNYANYIIVEVGGVKYYLLDYILNNRGYFILDISGGITNGKGNIFKISYCNKIESITPETNHVFGSTDDVGTSFYLRKLNTFIWLAQSANKSLTNIALQDVVSNDFQSVKIEGDLFYGPKGEKKGPYTYSFTNNKLGVFALCYWQNHGQYKGVKETGAWKTQFRYLRCKTNSKDYELISCERISDGAIGFLDLRNNQFRLSENSATFIPGPRSFIDWRNDV